MPLTVGARLGPYEVVSAIGAGGMGEVYRARDTKLNRDVAIKVLPESFASDPERLARFTREAQTLASLNHPNIAQIFGFEDEERLRPHRAEDEQIRGEVSASARAGGGAPAPLERVSHMCRNIKTLFNFDPPATDEEIKDASLQFVRKLSGFTKPSKSNATGSLVSWRCRAVAPGASTPATRHAAMRIRRIRPR
jgi:hypothetical protein